MMFKVIQGTDWKLVLVNISSSNINLQPTMHQFQDIANYWPERQRANTDAGHML